MMNILSYSLIALPEHLLDNSANYALLALLLLMVTKLMRVLRKISFLEQKNEFLLNGIHQVTGLLMSNKTMHEKLAADNLPPLVDIGVRRLTADIDNIINYNKSTLFISEGKKDGSLKTGGYELYSYITSLVNQYREYAENCRVELNLCKDAGYKSFSINEMAFTIALQRLVKRSIDKTRPNGSVNIVVSCPDDRCHLQISNSSPGKYYRKYLGLFFMALKAFCCGQLRFIWHVVRLNGGVITGYELGGTARYQIKVPLASDHSPVPTAENAGYDIRAGKQPHIVLIMKDSELSGYMKDTFSHLYRVSIYEHYEQITNPLSRENTDIIIIDTEYSGLCSKIKNNKQTSDVPVLLLAASNDAEELKELTKCRADRILPRTVSAERLIAEIHFMLEESEQWIERVKKLVTTDFSAGFPEDLLLSKEDAGILQKINGFLEKHLDKKIKITTLASELGVSPTKLYMLVTRITKVNTTYYILCFKMERAQKLLLTEEWSIADVATKLGFSVDKYFGIVFKKYFDCAPKDYRAKYGK